MSTSYSKHIKNNVYSTNCLLSDFMCINMKVEYHEFKKELKEYSSMYLINYNKTDPSGKNPKMIKAIGGDNKFNFERLAIFYKMIEMFNKNKLTLAISERTIEQIFENCFYKF